AKRIVPDVAEERASLVQARTRIRAAITHLVQRETTALEAIRSRPVLAAPESMIDRHVMEVAGLRTAAHRAFEAVLSAPAAEVERCAAQVRALSPAATLERGYAVVHRADGAVVRDPAEIGPAERLRIRLARGELAATADGAPAPGAGATG